MNLEQHLQQLAIHQETIKHLASLLSQQEAQTFREEPTAWTFLEVICHLRDFELVFIEGRIDLMLKKITPTFDAVDQNALVKENKYAQQTLTEMTQAFCLYRERTISVFKGLEPQQWRRMGIHPSQGRMTISDVLEHVLFHDAKHIRQLSRILAALKRKK
ncbi:MAG: DinB family protein [Trueperaceae bacterium]